MVRFREDEVGERVGHGSVQFQSRMSNVFQMEYPVGGQSRSCPERSVGVQNVQVVSRMFSRCPECPAGMSGSGRSRGPKEVHVEESKERLRS